MYERTAGVYVLIENLLILSYLGWGDLFQFLWDTASTTTVTRLSCLLQEASFIVFKA